MSSKRLTVGLPCYNEEENIHSVIESIFSESKNWPRKYRESFQVIVVDDSSTDRTHEILKELEKKYQNLRVLRNRKNRGSGYSIKRIIKESDSEYICLMDSDGQHSPKDILRLIRKIEETDADLVVAARQGLKDNASIFRYVANTIYNKLSSYVAGEKILDLTSGFRIFKRSVVKRFLKILPDRFSWPSTMTLSLIKSGYDVDFVKVRFYRRRGRSKINLIRDGSRFFLIIFRISTFYSPLKIFIPTSIMFFLISLSYYLYMFSKKSLLPKISLLLFSVSVMIFLMGLVSEQISQFRFEMLSEIEDLNENLSKTKSFEEKNETRNNSKA